MTAASRRRRPIAVECRAASAAARAKAPPSAGPAPQALAKEAHKYFDHAVVSVRAGDGGHGAVLNMPPGSSADAAPSKPRGSGRAADKGKAKRGSGKKVSFKRNYDGSVSLPVGGHGGDVVLYADEAEESLLGFHAKARHCAKRGGNVGATGTLSSRMHNGFAGETLRIPVPVGTVVRRKKASVLADLVHPGEAAQASQAHRRHQRRTNHTPASGSAPNRGGHEPRAMSTTPPRAAARLISHRRVFLQTSSTCTLRTSQPSVAYPHDAPAAAMWRRSS